MKVKPMRWNEIEKMYDPCAAAEATHIRLLMPGPLPNRILPVVIGSKVNGAWMWNGDTDQPTILPSIRSTDGAHICHCFVTAGIVHFCSDSTHAFAGQAMPLEDLDD